MPASSRPAPRVSIAIPTYNGAATIGAAIESVLAQTFDDWQLVVIDDGSADGTAAVVRRYPDARIRYLRNAVNIGAEASWNRCLDVADGVYFKLLPHDDVLRADCLALQVAALDADTQQRVALTFCARDVIGADGRTLARRGYPGRRAAGVLAAGDVVAACVRHGTNLVGEPGGVLTRTALTRRVGRFDATNPYVIDLDYWCRLLAHGDAHHCPDRLVAFRVSASQWSVAIGAHQSRDFHGFVRRLRRRGLLPCTALDRLFGRITPSLNNVLRLAFYRLYVR